MKRENVIQTKSYKFALKIVRLYQALVEKRKEFVLSKQILRSGTSIGANIEEAIGGQSKRDFRAKLAISYKEARETHYWIRILQDTGYLGEPTAKLFLTDCEELIKILIAIQKSTKINPRYPHHDYSL